MSCLVSQGVHSARGLELFHDILARQVGHEAIHKLGIRCALEQNRFLQARDRGAGEYAGERQPDVVNLAGYDVVFVDALRCQRKKRGGVHGPVVAAADLHLESEVGQDFGGVELKTPGLEQFRQRGAAAGDVPEHLVLFAAVHQRQRI